ncbi:unnamed protein product, partial [Allacma fusca]
MNAAARIKRRQIKRKYQEDEEKEARKKLSSRSQRHARQST